MKPKGRPQCPPGRPETRILKINATPEAVARAIVAAAKPPKPAK